MILTNKAQCLKCLDVIESTHVHDYKRCRCGAIAVDGGHEYIKRVGDLRDMHDLSLCKD